MGFDPQETVAFEPSAGRGAAERRVLLVDAAAFAQLRAELIEGLGAAAARRVLARFGRAQGVRAAAAEMQDEAPGQRAAPDPEAALCACRSLLRAYGLALAEPSARGGAPAVAFRESLEAARDRRGAAGAGEGACWMLCAFVAGYVGRRLGRAVECVEVSCVACGDPACVGVLRVSSEPDAAEPRAADAPPALQEELVAQSEAMRRVVDLALRAAKVDSTVLVTGESGVGKERIARLVHARSGRAKGPFLAIDCAAVAETLLESELFGHKKGAFTGAHQDRPGLLEAASGGTLLLDEVSGLSPAMQSKLLRVLQEREIRRVGENRARRVSVRVVAATNGDLAAEVSAGRFRRELYYRLRVIELRVPPLRERRDDVLPLAHRALALTCARLGRRLEGFTARAAQQMLRHEWPGNVRELENAVEQAAVLAKGPRVGLEDLPEHVRFAARVGGARVQRLEDVERASILEALRASGGNKARAAAALGIGTATLFRKLKRYGSAR